MESEARAQARKVLLSSLDEPRSSDPALEGALERILDAAAKVSSSFDERFVAHVAGKLGAGGLAEALDALHVDDLAIAWGAVHGDARAAGLLVELTDALVPAIVRAGLSRQAAVDCAQSLPASLILPRTERPAELLGYSGRGPLAAWLRVLAIRLVRHETVSARREESLDDAILERARTSTAVSSVLAKASGGAAISAALREAVRALDDKHRALLRYHVIESLGVTEIGAIYGVHRATAARWIAEAREALATGLRERLPGEPEEILSLVTFAASRVDVELEQLLGAR